MGRFMLLYVGPATPPNASHKGWPEWFAKLSDRLIDRGSPMADGRVLHGDGSTSGATTQKVCQLASERLQLWKATQRLIGNHTIVERR